MSKFNVSYQTQISHIFAALTLTECKLPLYLSPVSAGFPSPAEDFLEGELDLNEYLIRKPAATFHVRAVGDSMVGAGILSGDVLVVDRSIDPQSYNGQIVIAILNGELTVKRLQIDRDSIRLLPENALYSPIEITDCIDFEVWGVVIGVVRKCSPKSLP
jgi:DNA polymerase V